MDKSLALLFKIPGFESINVVRAQGNVKHYNVRIKTSDHKIVNDLMQAWPFNNTSILNDNTYFIDYLVRPSEVKDFYAKLSQMPISSSASKVGLMFKFNYPVTEEIKKQIEKSVRSSDQLIWSDKHLVVLLSNCGEEAVKAVQKRIEKILASQDILEISIQVG